MTDFWEAAARMSEAMFGSKQAPPPPDTKITLQELISRKTSHVRVGGRLYKVVVTEIELTKKV